MGEAAAADAKSREPTGGLVGLAKAAVARPEFVSFVALIVLMVLTASMNDNFLTVDNLLNITRQVSITGIIAVGMTFVILTGGIDLSVGAIVALASTMMAGMIANMGFPFWAAALLAIMGGTLTGTVTSIDSDVTSSNNGSYYKMTIKPDATYVVSRSGDKVDLSNGMSVTARVEYDQVTYFEYAMEALGVLFR